MKAHACIHVVKAFPPTGLGVHAPASREDVPFACIQGSRNTPSRAPLFLFRGSF